MKRSGCVASCKAIAMRVVCPEGDTTFSLQVVDVVPTVFPAVVYFECRELDETVKALQARGVQFDSLPRDEPWL